MVKSCCSSRSCGCTCKDELFHSWLSNTTIHGIVHVFTARSPFVRLIWAVIFLSATGGCLYNVVERLLTYLDSPTSTTVSFATNEDVLFPAVTVCNMNPVSRSYLSRIDREDAIFSLLLALSNPSVVLSLLGLDNTTDPTLQPLAWLDFCEFHAANNVTNLPIHEVFYDSKLPLFDFIDECTFIPTFESCKYMFTPVFTDIGLCYTLKLNKTVQKSGVNQGLRLVLNISQSEYLTPFYGNAGVRISVHPPGVFPEPDEQGIAVPPGKNAYIGLQEERIVDKTAQSNCQPVDTKLEYFPGAEYSLSRCKANAAIELFSRECNCRDYVGEPEFLKFDDYQQQPCRFSNVCCLFFVTDFVARCNPACVSSNYRKSVSYAQYPAEGVGDITAEIFNATHAVLSRDFIAVNIFFENLLISVSTTAYSYNFSAFLSDLGGQLGLFLGASVISMLEFMSFLLDEGNSCVSRYMMRCRSPKKKDKCNQQISNGLDRLVPRVVGAGNNAECIELNENPVADGKL